MKKPARLAPNVHLKRAREDRGWSQEDLALKIGTDVFTIRRWERKGVAPSPHFRQKLSALLGLSAAELGLLASEQAALSGQASGKSRAAVSPLPLAQAPIFDPAIPLPPAGTHGLVGRDDLLRQLKMRLLAGKTLALSALNGLPGVGKTALATALAHDEELRAHFADGVLWAGLGYEPDVLSLLNRWATVLGAVAPDLTQRSRPEAWAPSIHAAIGQRRLLLIIDDAWEIAHALAFKVGGPHCAHLITTRFPELARRFAAEGAITVRELEETEGRLLLMRLAPEVVEAEPEEAQALVAAVGGLPLALTLLGNFLRAQTHSGQPRRMRAALERVRSGNERLHLSEPQALVGGHPSFGAGTPLSLQAVIGISDQQVSEAARATLHALALFPPKPNSFSEEAALAVSSQSTEALDELLDAGLLESGGPERYLLHQTIADYGRAHAQDATVLERLVAYFVAYIEAHIEDYPALDQESNNILAALETAFERGLYPALVRGAHAFVPFLMNRGLYGLAEVQLQRSLKAALALEDTRGQGVAWRYLGKIADYQGHSSQASAAWQQALQLARLSRDQEGEALTLRELGMLAWHQGEQTQAHQLLAEALAILRQLGDLRGVANALMPLGNLTSEQGQPEQARAIYEEALALCRQFGDQRGAAIMLQNLGILAREQGQPERAQALYEQALEVFRQIGDQRGISVVLSNLGNLHRQLRHFEQAQQMLDEALPIQRQLGKQRDFAYTLLNLGSLATDQWHFKRAHPYLDEALAIFQELHARRESGLTLQALGALAREERGFEQAHQHLDEALAIAEELHDLRQEALTRRELGRLAREEGQFEQASQCYAKALAILQGLEDRLEVGLIRLELGILAVQQGRLDEAEALLTEELASARQIQDRHSVAQAYKELGRLRYQQRQWEQAAKCWLCAGVGFTLVNAPDAAYVEELLEQLRAHLGSEVVLSTARRVANEPPEQAYGLDQAAWALAVHQVGGAQIRTQSGETAFQAALEQAEQISPLNSSAPLSPQAVSTSKAPSYPAGLTAREVEILRLVAQGLTDVQVAEQLVISPRTVNWHLTSIYSKLGVSSRTAATRFAIEQQLV